MKFKEFKEVTTEERVIKLKMLDELETPVLEDLFHQATGKRTLKVARTIREDRKRVKLIFHIQQAVFKLKATEKITSSTTNQIVSSEPLAPTTVAVEKGIEIDIKDLPKMDNIPVLKPFYQEYTRLKADYIYLKLEQLKETVPQEERKQAAERIKQIKNDLLPELSKQINEIKEAVLKGEELPKQVEGPKKPITKADTSDPIEVEKRMDTVKTYLSKYKDDPEKQHLFEQYTKELEYLKAIEFPIKSAAVTTQ